MIALVVLAGLAVEPQEIASPTNVGRSAINAVVGDASVAAGYVAAGAGEDARIAGHLRFAHDLLASVDTRAWPAARRTARERNLARLAAYAAAGRFPRNDDHPDARRPTFVDDRGAICAVGALFAADRGRAAAERIARSYKYAFVPDIHDAELAAWQRDSGLSLRELAIIQPSYPAPEAPGELVLPAGLLDRMLAGADRTIAATEIFAGAVVTTLHAQAQLTDLYRAHFYATLPVAVATEPMPGDHRVVLENAEVGYYFAPMPDEIVVLRSGILLPTGSLDPPAAIGARVGDAVLGMSRAAGARLSLSIGGGPFLRYTSDWGPTAGDLRVGMRVDAGLDAVVTLDDRSGHLVPRGGVGLMYAGKNAELAVETAIARAPEPIGDAHVRWSAGITGRLGRGEMRRIEPALTLAAVHDPAGWAGTLTLELTYVRDHRQSR